HTRLVSDWSSDVCSSDLSRVVSIDGEGIWKACTMKAMTKTAITIVVASDCSEFMPPEWLRAGWCAPEAFGSWTAASADDSVRTSFMMARRACWRYRCPVSQKPSLAIVENPKPPVQLFARPAF